MSLRTNGATLALVGSLLLGLTACGGSGDTRTAEESEPQPVASAAYAAETAEDAPATEAHVADQHLVVYKTETCGCCGKWVDHMEAHGFDVEVHDLTQAELSNVKTAKGVTPGLASCHTAEIGGYVVEGHVPAEDLQRLLAEKPEGVKGIAVPGMPIGSPGMEMPDRPAEAYDVVTFDGTGETEVFASH